VQVFHHCRYLDRLHSVGSSQNNHAIAEAVGLLVGASEVPWFPQSVRWQRHGAERLLEVVRSNVDVGGLDRELATDYHGFVLELVTVAAVNATIHRRSEGAELWATAAAMTQAAACLTDPWGRPARQGDTDRGRVLVVQDDRRDLDRWASLLRRASLRDAVLAAYVGPLPLPDVGSDQSADCADRLAPGGQAVLLHTTGSGQRTWLRFDGGPHGHLAIAAHAHADALGFELRVDGVDILVDPGTFTYRPGSPWRNYFRSTRAHNAVELDGADIGGPGCVGSVDVQGVGPVRRHVAFRYAHLRRVGFDGTDPRRVVAERQCLHVGGRESRADAGGWVLHRGCAVARCAVDRLGRQRPGGVVVG
jgi:hypothetical protein